MRQRGTSVHEGGRSTNTHRVLSAPRGGQHMQMEEATTDIKTHGCVTCKGAVGWVGGYLRS